MLHAHCHSKAIKHKSGFNTTQSCPTEKQFWDIGIICAIDTSVITTVMLGNEQFNCFWKLILSIWKGMECVVSVYTFQHIFNILQQQPMVIDWPMIEYYPFNQKNIIGL